METFQTFPFPISKFANWLYECLPSISIKMFNIRQAGIYSIWLPSGCFRQQLSEVRELCKFSKSRTSDIINMSNIKLPRYLIHKIWSAFEFYPDMRIKAKVWSFDCICREPQSAICQVFRSILFVCLPLFSQKLLWTSKLYLSLRTFIVSSLTI